MEVVAAAGPQAGPRDIAQRAGLPQATAYRLLSQMQQLHLIERAGPGYRIGHRLLRIALGTMAEDQVRAAIEPDLQALADRTGETAFAARLTSQGIDLFLSRLAGEGRQGGVLPPMGARPLVCSATKAIVAFLPEAERDRLLAQVDARFPRFARSADPDFARELQGIAEGEVATCFGEENPDVGSFATPVPIRGSKGFFSIGVVGPRTRIEQSWTALRPPVEAAAAQMAERLGQVG